MTSTAQSDAGREIELPSFAAATGWMPVASGLAKLAIENSRGPDAEPGLALDYDFGSGTGFVVARREVSIALPDSWELRLLVRGKGPANTFELKLVDEAGTSVWWWKREKLALGPEWTELRISSRDVTFAWGPAGGGVLHRTGAVEIAIVAAPGGSGRVELAGFRLLDRTPRARLVFEASSSQPEHEADAVLGHEVETAWQSREGVGPHTLSIDLGEEREVGGLVIAWAEEAPAESFRVESRENEGPWKVAYDATIAGAAVSYVALPGLRARWLSLSMTAKSSERGVGIADIDVRSVEWSRTPVEFLSNVALASARGRWPRYLLREQSYWTPIATPRDGAIALLDRDGTIEIGEAGFSIVPSLMLSRKWITWADVESSVRLKQASLPIASVDWRVGGLELSIGAVAEDRGGRDTALLRYRFRNDTREELRATLFLSVLPLQVTPPWQTWRSLGGPSPIRSLDWNGARLSVNDSVSLRPITRCRGFGVAGFDEGGVAERLRSDSLPERHSMADAAGRAEGVFAFDVTVAPGKEDCVFVEALLPRRWHLGAATTEDVRQVATPAEATAPLEPRERVIEALKDWASALPTSFLSGSPGAVEAAQCAVTAVGHILCCRDGAALQPGPRRYARSWIRDGAIMSAALLRAGLPATARCFVEWYAPHQRADGFVPCCVDREGVDPLVEHDSHGQLIYAVAETYRFTRDRAFLETMWPHCTRAAAYIESLRAARCTEDYEGGELHACYGLLPESVSHEGYLAQPVHSYWDDFWALRGLRDASYLARELGLGGEEARWREAAELLGAAITSSMRMVMKDRGLDTLPASVEWADFDPTAIAGALSLIGAQELLPAEALARTFDEYMRGFRARRDGTLARPNYAPYEVRIVGALVCMGRREEANELLDALLGDRRPLAWNQWPEIVWKDPEAPAHLGDLPHCWIGAEYAIALRWMLVYERESDGALVIGAGLREDWLDCELDARDIATWYGSLDLRIERAGEGYTVFVGGKADPPGGFVAALPRQATIRRA